MTWKKEEQDRVAGYRRSVLNDLLNGPKTNFDLIPITHRFSAVIHQLREAGHLIESRHVRGGTWKYTYLGKTEVVRVTKIMQSVYYQTTHWKNKRQERLTFDKNTCCQCKETNDLGVHHWEYDLFEEELQSLMTLCKDCHEHLHFNPHVQIKFPRTVPQQYELILKPRPTSPTPESVGFKLLVPVVCDHAADKLVYHTVIGNTAKRVVCRCGKFIGYTKQPMQSKLFGDVD